MNANELQFSYPVESFANAKARAAHSTGVSTQTTKTPVKYGLAASAFGRISRGVTFSNSLRS